MTTTTLETLLQIQESMRICSMQDTSENPLPGALLAEIIQDLQDYRDLQIRYQNLRNGVDGLRQNIKQAYTQITHLTQ